MNIKSKHLKIISTDGGFVMRCIKASESEYKGFGEAYFSWINYKIIRAWKLHLKMTLNLFVPYGRVKFVFFYDENPNNFHVEEIGKDIYKRLTISPGIWFGFQGLQKSGSLIMNIADIEHDPNEVIKKPLNSFNFDWNIK
jgi:dTDP-4-dehydrorhamnose 3,5-epimerase